MIQNMLSGGHRHRFAHSFGGSEPLGEAHCILNGCHLEACNVEVVVTI